ncbi:MAG: hypothetical protein UFP41_02145 [Bacilli bacterium]|nr:hypothetical protein [Bacilli bacterium]
MKKKNIILLIIAIVMFILVGSTMAYFGWSSSAENKDQLVDVTVAGGTGSCDKLSDNNKLLYPTSTREKGRILKVTTKQQMAKNAFVTWNLVVNSINETTLTTSGLKHKSFKYELVNDTTGVSYGTGSFENVTNGTTITFSTDKETLDYNKEYTFILYLWIDGTIGNNPLDMTNQPYNFDLNCNITGTSTKIVPTDTYQLTNGDGTTYTPTYTGSGTKAVRSTAPLSKFREVRVDDTVVDSSNYTIIEGSTIVTFKESYLKSLSVGDHTLKIVSTDGLTSGILTIKKLVIPAATYITNLYTTASKTTATNNSITYNYANIYDTDSDDNTSGGLMNDRLGGTTTSLDGGNIRYYGASPNNYIYFNCSDYSNQTSSTCETWRIIGVFDGKLKLIRGSQIGSLAWDQDKNDDSSKTTYDNDWSTATLQKLLNGSYYNGSGTVTYYSGPTGTTTTSLDMTSIGIKNETTRNMIAETTYYLGGWNSNSVYPNLIYKKERGTTVYTGRPTTPWTGKIALAYPSDYGYAVDLNQCKDKTLDYYNDSTCTSNNWMKAIFGTSGNGWLLTPYSGSSYGAWYVNFDGLVNDNSRYGACSAIGVVPVLSLSSGLSIESGDGSSSSPYKLNA